MLTDLVMPDRLNGRELAEKLWAERPRLKVIFTSGYSADAVGKDFCPAARFELPAEAVSSSQTGPGRAELPGRGQLERGRRQKPFTCGFTAPCA